MVREEIEKTRENIYERRKKSIMYVFDEFIYISIHFFIRNYHYLLFIYLFID